MTGFPANNTLDQIFITLIKRLAESGTISFEAIFVHLTKPDTLSDDDMFQKSLNGDIYKTNTVMVRFFLAKIEMQHDTKERKSDFWEKEKKQHIWTIEHILPQKLSADWVDMIAKGNEEEARSLQEQYVHKL